MLSFGAIPKNLFFDRKAVVSAVDRATRKVFGWFGGRVRLQAKHSMKKPPKQARITADMTEQQKEKARKLAVSRPGRPPFRHTDRLYNLIFYAYDRDRRSVVIGPLRFRRGEAPPLLEYGGQVTRRRRGKRRRMKYKPRPFMGPAFEKETPKLPSMWANSVK